MLNQNQIGSTKLNIMGPLFMTVVIYTVLNICWFKMFLVISFVFPQNSGRFYTAFPLPRKVPAQHYWACIHGNTAPGYTFILYTVQLCAAVAIYLMVNLF
jgi:hypothetical protein